MHSQNILLLLEKKKEKKFLHINLYFYINKLILYLWLIEAGEIAMFGVASTDEMFDDIHAISFSFTPNGKQIFFPFLFLSFVFVLFFVFVFCFCFCFCFFFLLFLFFCFCLCFYFVFVFVFVFCFVSLCFSFFKINLK